MANKTLLTQKSSRNSSFELLKILAIALIIISHSIPKSGPNQMVNLSYATSDTQLFLLKLYRNLGQIGNAIFITCSSWFLLKSTKIKKEKIIYILADNWVINIFWLIAIIMLGYSVSGKDIIKSVFPTTYDRNWFVKSYLIFYTLHPLLNKIIYSISKKNLLLINVINILLYASFNTIKAEFFYTDLLGFVVIYFMVAYQKLYLAETTSKAKINFIFILIGIIGWLGSMLALNYLGLHISALCNKSMLLSFNTNPFYLMIVFGLFHIMRHVEFHSVIVNTISGYSLLIYLLHENQLGNQTLRIDLFQYIQQTFSFDYLWLWVLAVAAFYFAAAFIVSVFYRHTVRKIVTVVCDRILDCIERVYGKVTSHILQWN